MPTADGKGRAAAAEVLIVTPAVRNLIREGKGHQIPTQMQAGAQFGMVTFGPEPGGLGAVRPDHHGRGARVRGQR